jgi:hypothetical protein
VIEALEEDSQLPKVFRQLDVNGDGTVTLTDILGFHGDTTGAVDKLLPYIQEQLQLGLAREEVDTLPGVTFRDLIGRSPSHEPASLRTRMTDGIAAPQGGSRTQLPAVLLGAFADGSERGEAEHQMRHQENAVGSFFQQAQFYSRLEAVDPGDPNNIGWSGLFRFVDPDRSSLDGALVGLLRPGTAGAGPSFEGLVIGQDGVGRRAGSAGIGRFLAKGAHFKEATITARFSATLRVRPFALSSLRQD